MLDCGQLDVVAEQLVQLGHHVVGPEAREQTAVQFHGHLARDDVDRVAGTNVRGTDRVVQ